MCRPEDQVLPAGFPGDPWPRGSQSVSRVCRRGEVRRGNPAGSCIPRAQPARGGRVVRGAGARLVVKGRKPERNKNGRKKPWEVGAAECGGKACIPVTQESIRPNVKYVRFSGHLCGLRFSGHLWGLETSM